MLLLLFIIIPLVSSFVSMMIRKNHQNALGIIAAVSSFSELIITFVIGMDVFEYGVYSFTSYLSVDSLGLVLLAILAISNFSASWYSGSYLKAEMGKGIIGFARMKQYFILLHLFILAMFLAVITTNPIIMWISIEATTLSTAFLISFYNKPTSMEAAWKYLIINSVGLLLGFFGTILFLYPAMASGNLGLINWQILISDAKTFNPFIAKIAFIFILTGYGTKVGLAPMHTWLPDAHSKAPAPISALFSGVLLNVAFLAVLRFKSVIDISIGKYFSQELFIFFGVLSIVIAAFIIFIQKNYKRLLAYHSIEHMGIITLGFGFGGIASFAALLHLIYHSLAKSALFLLAGNIILKYSSTKMEKVRGMIKALPVTSVLFFIGFLALAGVPPFGIFITEFTILSEGIKINPVITIIVLFSLVLVVAGIIKHVSEMIFGKPVQSIPDGEAGVNTVFPIIILIAILIFISFFIPASMQSLLHSATVNF
jgi:hydrogenase-4 component F